MSEPRRKNLRQYILYLHTTADKELIDHLQPHVDVKRGNAEARRLLYVGLNGAPVTSPLPQKQSTSPLPATQQMDAASDGSGVQSDAKKKARAYFGTFGK